MSNILVTGCCGTTGTSLVKFLLANTSDSIYGVDNFYKGTKENLDEIYKADTEGRFSFNEKDCTTKAFYDDLNSLYDGGERIDKIYNLFAIVETPRFYDSPYETFKTNCLGAVDLFKWAMSHKVKKFVNCSSSEVYGHLVEVPIKESTSSLYDSVETSPRWSYAHGKILTEYIMNQLAENSEMMVCHLRYANVYGEHDIAPVHVVPYILHQLIYGEVVHVNEKYETIQRTFLHNDDSTLGTYLAMENMRTRTAYNIGSPEEVTIQELLHLCIKVLTDLGVNLQKNLQVIADIHRDGDPIRRVLDTTRAHDDLGFKCQVSLYEGIRRTAERILTEYNKEVTN